MSRRICYCFNHTEEDIIEDVRRHGTRRILAEIKTAKRWAAASVSIITCAGSDAWRMSAG